MAKESNSVMVYAMGGAKIGKCYGECKAVATPEVHEYETRPCICIEVGGQSQ